MRKCYKLFNWAVKHLKLDSTKEYVIDCLHNDVMIFLMNLSGVPSKNTNE